MIPPRASLGRDDKRDRLVGMIKPNKLTNWKANAFQFVFFVAEDAQVRVKMPLISMAAVAECNPGEQQAGAEHEEELVHFSEYFQRASSCYYYTILVSLSTQLK